MSVTLRPAPPEGRRGSDPLPQRAQAAPHGLAGLSAHWQRAGGAADPSLRFVAEEGSDPVGLLLCYAQGQGDPELGWVGVLGVLRPWRGRGTGSALLAHAFAVFRARGYRRVGLGVDAENPTGAVRLYERAGMRVAHAYEIWERPL